MSLNINKPHLCTGGVWLGNWTKVFQFAKPTGQDTFHLRNQCKVFRDSLTLPPEYRFWRLKTVDQHFTDSRWVINHVSLYDYANRELTGKMMASSAQGSHSQGKFGNYIDDQCYVGKDAHNDGNFGGYWSADYGKNDWIGIDLGVGCTSSACRLVIKQESTIRPRYPANGHYGHHSNHYLVQSSSDGTTWNTEHECFFCRAGDSKTAVTEEYNW